MRILMLSPGYPLPPDNGSKRRILAAACHLRQNHELVFVSLREPHPMEMPTAGKNGERWQGYVIDQPMKSKIGTAFRALLSRHSYSQVKYWNRRLQETVGDLLSNQNFDCIWVEFLFMITYLEPWFFKISSGQKPSRPIWVLDEHNVDELVFKSFLGSKGSQFLKWYAKLEMRKAQHLQRKWYPRFDAILCVSPEDLQKTAQYVDPPTNVWLVPNGVDIEYFRPVKGQDSQELSSLIVFGGSLDVRMNQDAVLWFSDRIFPLIQQQIPSAEFCIVGRNPTPEVWKLAERRGIRVTGTVMDVRDYYGKAGVFVVPLRMGGGTKLKTVEAMAMALPIVSTSVGAQGLDIQSGRDMYVAERPDEFAACVVDLLEDRGKAARMGAAARSLVEKNYSWNGIFGNIDDRLKNLFQERESRRKRV